MAEIGAQLREARMRARIDINEVEARTKIRAKYLRAMENEEWDLLPGDVYVRSFLRSYGEFLGLDTRQLLDDFRRQYEAPSDHEPPPIVPPGREQRARGAARARGRPRGPGPPRRRLPSIAPAAVTVLVLAIVVAALWYFGTRNTSSSGSSTTPRAASTHHHSRAKGRRHPAPKRAPAKPTVVHLSLHPTGEVYVCLVDGAGHELIPGKIFDTGDTIPVQTAGKLLLTLGNANVTIKANGAPVALAPASPIGLQFTPGGHAALPAARQPSCT